MGEERAQVSKPGDPHRQEAAVGVERQRCVHVVVAAVEIRQKAVRPAIRPAHWTSQRTSGVQQANILGVDGRFHAERAADAARQHADHLRLHAEHAGDARAHAPDALRSELQREAAGFGVERRHGRARLHGAHDDAVVQQAEPRHMRGGGEGGGHRRFVAEMIIERRIAWRVLVEEGRACGSRGARLRDSWKRIDRGCYGLGRIVSLRGGFRHDESNGVAHIADAIGRQRAARHLHHG